MTLRSAEVGGAYVVEDIELDMGTKRRLGALGITKGTPVRMLNRNRGGTVILMVRGSRLAIGKNIAGAIEIRRLSYEKRIDCRLCR